LPTNLGNAFAASCGGAPIGVLKAYFEQQKTPL
jgi:hypothetical protein